MKKTKKLKSSQIFLVVALVVCIVFASLFLVKLITKSNSIENKLFRMGYSDEDIAIIVNLSDESKSLLLENYEEKNSNILHNSFFEEENLDLYLKYYGQSDLDDDTLFKVINNGYVREYGLDVVQGIFTDPFYIENNKDKYFKYSDRFETYREVVEYVNVQRYDEYYTNVKPTDLSKGYLILLNKYNYLEEDYVPDLVAVSGYYGVGYMREEPYEAYALMYEDALKEGYDIRVVSSYRMWSTQYRLYYGYMENDPQEVVDTYSARPGYSEHQTGLAIDVSIPGCSLDDFIYTDASDWLKEHCYEYGFIIRYPEGKDDITGYQYEPWHIRYVGTDASSIIKETGITFDEYYAYYIENKTN